MMKFAKANICMINVVLGNKLFWCANNTHSRQNQSWSKKDFWPCPVETMLAY